MRATLLAAALFGLVVAGPWSPNAWPLRLPSLDAAAVTPQSQDAAQARAATLSSDEEIERFLREAKVVRTRSTSKGITGSLRATLSDGVVTHDAQIQSIDERKAQFDSPGGTEFNFRDSWLYNVAAYRLDRLIGMNLVPVSVKRKWRTNDAAFTWWIDDVLMDEGERIKKQMSPPRPQEWNEQMQLVRVFDQLIYNIDRNMGNLLICKDWRIWAIDHTRAFRTHSSLKSPANVTRCDRQMLERMKQLDRASLDRALGSVLTSFEIGAVLARRDAIVALIEKAGPSAVFERRVGEK